MIANRMGRITHVVLLAALALAGCGGGDAADEAAEPEAEAPTPTTNPAGMVNQVGTRAAIAGMLSSLGVLEATPGEDLVAMVPRHRQATEALISQMEAEMRTTGKAVSADWQATAQSVRQELAGMAEMSAAQLEGAMKGHAANVRRLIDLHESARP